MPILLLAAAATTAGSAKADPINPSDSDKAAARPFAIEGLRLAQAGNCKEAVEQLDKAEALVHAPTTAVPLAQCEIQLGKIIAGTELLNRVLNESLPANAPPSWAEAKKQARTILDAAEPKIAKLRIHVEGPPGEAANADVTVDGQPVPKVLLDNDRPTDPGPHHIVARQAGVGGAEADVSLSPGQMLPVDLRLSGGAAAGGAAAPATGGTPDPYGTGTVPATTPAAAAEAGAPWMAFEFGARLAYGVPLGSAEGGNGNDLDHTISNQIIPLWINAGVRFLSHWYAGAYFSFGLASLSNQFGGATNLCNETGVGCSSNDTRLGIEAAYHVLPDGFVDPWFGLGFGYEWLSATVTGPLTNGTGTGTLSYGVDGWELLNLMGGVDFRLLNGALGVGPFVSLALAQYDHQSVPNGTNGGTTGSSITSQALHEWFLIGAKGSYDLKF
ncbi:MAG TPA: autotransporter outer membrane beta-barrel domain-containing protein [Polyangiaceae bacterium]